MVFEAVLQLANAPLDLLQRGLCNSRQLRDQPAGGPASHGCIRLHPANAATLFALVKSEGIAATTIVVSGSNPVLASRRAPSPRRYGPWERRPSSEERYRPDDGQSSGYYWRLASRSESVSVLQSILTRCRGAYRSGGHKRGSTSPRVGPRVRRDASPMDIRPGAEAWSPHPWVAVCGAVVF